MLMLTNRKYLQIEFLGTWHGSVDSCDYIYERTLLVLFRALIWYWDHLKNFIAEIPQGPLGMSFGTIWVTQKWFQGPPARVF